MQALTKGFMIVLPIISACWTAIVTAAPVIESFDRFELNWTSMKIRFYGESTVASSNKGYSEAEKAAIEDGILYALTSLTNVRAEKGLGQGYKNLPNDFTKQSYLFNTSYYADGRVRTEMESSLVKALDLGGQNYLAEDQQSQPTDATAVLVNVRGLKGPRMLSGIYSTDGELLHDSGGVMKASYRKNALGKWFYRNSGELKAFSGANASTIEGQYSGGRLLVNKADWDNVKKTHQKLLEESKVAFILYGSGKNLGQ